MTKHSVILILLTLLPLSTIAQTGGSNSSYSRYGLGTLSEQSQTFNRGMGGVALGLRNGKRVNMLNPASYSAIDSLSFLFDVGMNLQYGHLSSSTSKVNVRNSSFSNVNAAFRLTPVLGMSFGFVPYSSIGYSFENTKRVNSDQTFAKPISTVTKYTGNGGIHQVYIGAGWNPFAKLSIGANISFLWGDYEHSMAQVFYEGTDIASNYNTQNNTYSANIYTYKLDLGLQYPIRLSDMEWLTIGATYSLGHNVNNDATLSRYTSAKDTLNYTAENAFSLPHTFGAGLAWTHKDQWLVAADVTHEMWDGCKMPMVSTTSGNNLIYNVRTDQFVNRTSYKVGLEYTPNAQNREKYAQTIKYRFISFFSA